MKKIAATITLIAGFLPYSSNASNVAGLFLEPGISYEWGEVSANYPAPIQNTKTTANGFGAQAKLGFHVGEIFFIAADARYSRLDFNINSSGYHSDANSVNWGLTGGLQMPVAGARAWVSWISNALIDPGATNGLDIKFSEGSGWRAGIGAKLNASISFNLEYQTMNYNKIEIQQIGPYNSSTVFAGTQLKSKSYLFSVTFPMTI